MLFFFSYLTATRPALGHWWGNSLTHLLLISAHIWLDPKVTRSLAVRLVPKPSRTHQWDLHQEPTDSELTHYPALPLSTLISAIFSTSQIFWYLTSVSYECWCLHHMLYLMSATCGKKEGLEVKAFLNWLNRLLFSINKENSHIIQDMTSTRDYMYNKFF